MLGKIIVIALVVLIIAFFIRKYYRIFKGKGSACSCGQKNINPKSGLGCGCCQGLQSKTKEFEKTNSK